MERLKKIRRHSSALSNLDLTVETILSPNLAKSVVDAGGLTTSTICSPPLVVPQEGLNRDMKLSPSSPAAVFEAKFCVAGWTVIGLVVLGELGSTLDMLWRTASNALVEGTELLVATGSKTVPVETAPCGLAVAGVSSNSEPYLEIGLQMILQNTERQSSLLNYYWYPSPSSHGR